MGVGTRQMRDVEKDVSEHLKDRMNLFEEQFQLQILASYIGMGMCDID